MRGVSQLLQPDGKRNPTSAERSAQTGRRETAIKKRQNQVEGQNRRSDG